MTPLFIDMKVQKLVEHAEIPERAHKWDAGLDLVATDMYHDREYGFVEYGTGIAVEIPKGYVGLLFPRSSVSKKDLQLANSVGVIDSNYRGEVKLRYRHTDDPESSDVYSVGDRVGQLVLVPCPQVRTLEVEKLSDTSRGTGGFGSSGT